MIKTAVNELRGVSREPSDHTTPQVGIEIEVEQVLGYTDSPEFSTYWGVTTDGSLRNHGMEFVSKVLAPAHVSRALDMFYASWRTHGYRTHMRCGIHVHMDCTNMYLDDLGGIFTTYALIEPALYQFCGENREENIYCIPWYRAPKEVDKLCSSLFYKGKMAGSIKRQRLGQLCKYLGLYAGPLVKFGTIEYRHAPTWTDANTTKEWLNIIQAAFTYGRNRTSDQVLETWYSNPRLILRTIFGPSLVALSSDNMIQKIEELESVSVAEKFLNVRSEPKWDTTNIETDGTGTDGLAEMRHAVPNEVRYGVREGQLPLPEPPPPPAPDMRTINDLLRSAYQADVARTFNEYFASTAADAIDNSTWTRTARVRRT